MNGAVSGSITNMVWRPRLIRLTQPGNQAKGEANTPTFVDPSAISWIRCNYSKWKNENDETQPERYLYTEVHCCHYIMTVIETPEEIARLRDEAFGFPPASTTPSLRSV